MFAGMHEMAGHTAMATVSRPAAGSAISAYPWHAVPTAHTVSVSKRFIDGTNLGTRRLKELSP